MDSVNIVVENTQENVYILVDENKGADGVGVPSGGTTGQKLVKKSNTNYDTEWVSDSSNQQMIFIQQTQPTGNYNWTWWELDGSNNLKTIWVNII